MIAKCGANGYERELLQMTELAERILKNYGQNKEWTNFSFDWDTLAKIREDYVSRQEAMLNDAFGFIRNLQNLKKVHSVRYRTKTPDGLVAKLCRQHYDDGKAPDFSTYRTDITDLIGIRALHLFLADGEEINKQIIEGGFQIEEGPVANVSEGDPTEHLQNYVAQVRRKTGYRSVHYLIQLGRETRPCLVELQVRTLQQEFWGEIDHLYHYPYGSENPLLVQLISFLSLFTRASDELGSYVAFLNTNLNNWKRADQEYQAHQAKTTELKAEIEALKESLSQSQQNNETLKEDSILQAKIIKKYEDLAKTQREIPPVPSPVLQGYKPLVSNVVGHLMANSGLNFQNSLKPTDAISFQNYLNPTIATSLNVPTSISGGYLVGVLLNCPICGQSPSLCSCIKLR